MTKLIHRKYVSEELLEEHWSGSVETLEWLQRLLDRVELPALREKLFGLVCGAERS
ncbi:MAG TPA: hypothetical protein RMH85_24525 [Polyangiaceae bacterium LLY-WYZ-15_(1-7)]|nr:hypothetical protein [Polyangiaceae bacterium LLY-WYZ-15_(1-7)]HJL02374.1 hypothetical protein [Polyangiaceae bacterium LLY-WYZ-15_(1-7)]HJL11664.1 hypothetical protein [Polyangiaceae bacterium LLY-WYZ-15_(1-7)]HJL20785.1 hypothetical protein [Polyangiaceae bacterium LLY-WYZ-15_(1-7)]HJL32102.1 hypothetical protein [Polyangiaceae bacterium LLY-WYZ-15_(1-7)]